MNRDLLSAICMSAVILLAGCGGLTVPSYEPSTLTDESPTTTAPPAKVPTSVDTPTPIPATTDSDNVVSDLIGATPPPSVTCTINGTDTDDEGVSDDELYGTPGDDVICAGDGDDEIYAGTGNDIIYAGYGVDSVFGGSDEWVPDDYNGSGPDDDIIFGGPGTDVLSGHQGDDIIYAHQGFGSLDGGPGGDVLFPGFEFGGSISGGNGSDVAVMINGAMNAWSSGSEPSTVPLYSPKKLPVGFNIPINSTDPKKMISASVLKDRVGITTSGDVCICDPQDKTL